MTSATFSANHSIIILLFTADDLTYITIETLLMVYATMTNILQFDHKSSDLYITNLGADL